MGRAATLPAWAQCWLVRGDRWFVEPADRLQRSCRPVNPARRARSRSASRWSQPTSLQ